MSTILSSITQSVRDSKKFLDDLQEASIEVSSKKKKNPSQPIQILEIRQQLHFYWGNVANFMQIECYQTANKVVGLQDAESPYQLITALAELKTAAEECIVQAKTLVGQHDAFIQFFRTHAVHLPRSDAVASFTNGCGALRAGLVDLLALIEKQRRACATSQTTNYTPARLEEFIALGEEWKPHVTKVNETYIRLKSLTNDIKGSGVKGPKKSGGCIIM
jgi:hypothetical protein